MGEYAAGSNFVSLSCHNYRSLPHHRLTSAPTLHLRLAVQVCSGELTSFTTFIRLRPPTLREAGFLSDQLLRVNHHV